MESPQKSDRKRLPSLAEALPEFQQRQQLQQQQRRGSDDSFGARRFCAFSGMSGRPSSTTSSASCVDDGLPMERRPSLPPISSLTFSTGPPPATPPGSTTPIFRDSSVSSLSSFSFPAQPHHHHHHHPHPGAAASSSPASPDGSVASAINSTPSTVANGMSTPASPRRDRRKRGNLPKHTTDVLRTWLESHIQHPYPTEGEKRTLARHTNLTLNQISNWFINARRRRIPSLTRSQTKQEADENYKNGLAKQDVQHTKHDEEHYGELKGVQEDGVGEGQGTYREHHEERLENGKLENGKFPAAVAAPPAPVFVGRN